jgi:hypothetical protein
MGVWLFDLIPDHLHTLGFFHDPKREVLSKSWIKSTKTMVSTRSAWADYMVWRTPRPPEYPFFSVPELAEFEKELR